MGLAAQAATLRRKPSSLAPYARPFGSGPRPSTAIRRSRQWIGHSRASPLRTLASASGPRMVRSFGGGPMARVAAIPEGSPREARASKVPSARLTKSTPRSTCSSRITISRAAPWTASLETLELRVVERSRSETSSDMDPALLDLGAITRL